MKNVHIAMAIFFSINYLFSQDAQLDPAFGNDGIVVTNFGNNLLLLGSTDIARDVIIQPDGNIVAVGSTTVSVTGLSLLLGISNFAIARYTTNGALDTTFSGDGLQISGFGLLPDLSNDRATSVALQADNNIVVGGLAGGTNFGLMRFLSNGSLDSSFDGNGKKTTSIGVIDIISHLCIRNTDQKIVAIGTTGPLLGLGDVCLVRYNTNGSEDVSFDTNGIVTTNIGTLLGLVPSTDTGVSGICLNNNKTLALAATTANPFSIGLANTAVLQYEDDGSLDTNFGTNGIAIYNIGDILNIASSLDTPTAITLTKNNNIIITGTTTAGALTGITNVFIMKLDATGTLDTTFGVNGVNIVNIGTQITPQLSIFSIDSARDVVVESDGNIIVSGTTSLSGISNFFKLKFSADGHINTLFGDNGVALINIDAILGIVPTPDSAAAMALQTDGKVVIAGTTFDPNIVDISNFTVIRCDTSQLFITEKPNTRIVCPGQNLTYKITIENKNNILSNTVIQEIVPSNTTFRSVKMTHGFFDKTTNKWHIPSLLPNETACSWIRLRVDQFPTTDIIENTIIAHTQNIVNGSAIDSTVSLIDEISILPVQFANMNHISQRTDCGLDDLQCTVDLIHNEFTEKFKQVSQQIIALTNVMNNLQL